MQTYPFYIQKTPWNIRVTIQHCIRQRYKVPVNHQYHIYVIKLYIMLRSCVWMLYKTGRLFDGPLGENLIFIYQIFRVEHMYSHIRFKQQINRAETQLPHFLFRSVIVFWSSVSNILLCRRLQRKPQVSDLCVHHDTCVTHVPWCMFGLLTRGGGKTFPALPAHAQPEFYVSGKRPMQQILGSWRYVYTICHCVRSAIYIDIVLF